MKAARVPPPHSRCGRPAASQTRRYPNAANSAPHDHRPAAARPPHSPTRCPPHTSPSLQPTCSPYPTSPPPLSTALSDQGCSRKIRCLSSPHLLSNPFKHPLDSRKNHLRGGWNTL